MKQTVSIVGAGLAGLAAAVRLRDLWMEHSQKELEIHLFDASKHLGGRASSYIFSQEEGLLDNAQHLTMNCCTMLLEFLRRTDLFRFWEPQREMTFCVRIPNHSYSGYAPCSRLGFYSFRNSRIFPHPLNLLPSLLRLKYLTFLERIELLGVLRQMQRSTPAPGLPFREWLEDLACPGRIMDLFFEPITLSAFSDTLESVSAHMAQVLFSQMLFESHDAWHMWIPQRPLRDIFDAELTPFLEKAGIHLHRNTPVQRVFRSHLRIQENFSSFSSFSSLSSRSSSSSAAKESDFPTDATILAVPWWSAAKLMPELAERKTFNPNLFNSRTITAVHFWTDKKLFSQNNLVFPKETIQWIFRPPYGSGELGSYHQALISDSDRCCSEDLASLERVTRAELTMLFPEAKISHLRVTRTPSAVFSCDTWMDHSRPTFLTPFRSVFLAGDWTATDLPATMEGAVKSGWTAATETNYFLQNLRETPSAPS